MRKVRLIPLVSFIVLLMPICACILPDDIAQVRKDVADVQRQLRAIEQSQADTQQQLSAIEAELEGGAGVNRSEFADVQLGLDEVARNVAILDERVNEANWRVDRLSQNIEEVRELARRQPTSPAATLDPTATRGSGRLPAGGPGPSGSRKAVTSPEALYNAAYADFAKGDYALAVSGFEEYVSRFADSDLADNALYWVGECHFSQGNFAQAVEAFDRLLDRYPKSDRAAAADLKKGLAYLEQNEIAAAIVQLRHVVIRYPSTDEARIARDKLASLGAPVR